MYPFYFILLQSSYLYKEGNSKKVAHLGFIERLSCFEINLHQRKSEIKFCSVSSCWLVTLVYNITLLCSCSYLLVRLWNFMNTYVDVIAIV